jgi:outer membrane immunogenic protein
MSSTAFAADLILEEPEAVYSPAAYDWNGFYVGVNGGYGGGTFEHPFSLSGFDGEDVIELANGSIDVTAGGFLYGVQAGYNVQMDNILFGLEGDIQGSTIEGRVSLSITDEDGIILPPGSTLDADAGTSLDLLATLRPRLGFVQDRFVVYATGGLAWGQTTSNISASVEGISIIDESVTNDRFGWTIGAGVEYALTDTITFKTEYLYTDLGSANLIDADFGEGGNFTLDSDVAFHVVRAGLNFQF